MSTTEALRPVAAAASLLRSLGLALPDAVEEPRRLASDLRHEIPTTALDPRAFVRGVIDADGPAARRKAMTAAAKEYAVANAERDLRRVLAEVAASDALAALHAHADEITSAVLDADALAEAFEVLAEIAPRIPVGTSPTPDYETDGPAVTADVFRVRGAADVFAGVLSSLAAIPSLGVPGEVGLLAPLLYLSPDYAEVTRSDVERALRGVRPGSTSGSSWKVTGYGPDGRPLSGFTPDAPRGIPTVILASLGVPFARVSSLDEWRDRAALLSGEALSGVAAWEGDAEPEAEAASA